MISLSAVHVLECTRTQVYLPGKLFFCQAKFDGSFRSKVVLTSSLAAEIEEVKAVLTSFLKKQGLSTAVAARTINRSDLFINHLLSKLHSKHKSWHPVGRELTTVEIRDALLPYFESLVEEHGDVISDLAENFPNLPSESKLVAYVDCSDSAVNSSKLKAVSRVSETTPAGQLSSRTVYLMELGMDLEQIKRSARKFPPFAYYSLEGKIKPLVEFLLDLGVPKSDIPFILIKRPQLCGFSLSENLIPTMRFFENLGVDKRQWPIVIHRCPWILTHSTQKVEKIVAFFYEMGLSAENIGKILTRFPNIVGYSLETNLRPTSSYLLSLGVDVAGLLLQSPQIFGLSVESNLKPVTDFFLEKGCTLEEVKSMISKFGPLYTYSLSKNLTPKWEFLLIMGYSKEDLVKFPQYFGYSLEKRIKLRYVLVKASGVKFTLSHMLSLSDLNFDKALKKKVEKILSDSCQTDKDSGCCSSLACPEKTP